jgi:hypothetical protein
LTQGDLEEEPEEDPNEEDRSNDNNEDPDLSESTPSPVVPIKTKMTPINFDSALEHFVVHFLKVKLTHEIDYALDQAFVNTFDEFRSTDPVNVHNFTYKLPGDTNANGQPLHMMLVKQIQGGTYYCRFLEDNNDLVCDDPTMMDYAKFSKWRWNGQAVYQASLNTTGTVITPPSIGSTTAAYISTVQKDNDAALISWNRKPRDVAKYPILKTDAGYPDWRLTAFKLRSHIWDLKRGILRGCISLKNRSCCPLLRHSTSPFKRTCLLTRVKEVLVALYLRNGQC